MTITTSTSGTWQVVTLAGRMDEDGTEQFDALCARLMSEGAQQLIIDFAALLSISSMGLRSMLALQRRLEAAGGSLRVAGLQGLVRQVFQVTHLLKLFTVFDSVEAAAE